MGTELHLAEGGESKTASSLGAGWVFQATIPVERDAIQVGRTLVPKRVSVLLTQARIGAMGARGKN